MIPAILEVMTMTNTDVSNWVNRDLKEKIESGNLNVVAEMGLMSYDMADYIMDYYEKYEMYHGHPPTHPDHGDDGKYQRLVRRSSTRELNRAIASDNVSRIAYATGHNEQSGYDVGDWDQIEILKDLFRSEPQYTDLQNSVFQGIIFSNRIPPTGRGKSATMYTLTEIAQTVYPNIDIKSNNPSDEYDTIPEEWSKIEEWIESDGWNLLLVDEAKQVLMYDDQNSGKKLSKKMGLFRHNKTHFMAVGHTGVDIPKDMRRQMFFINKLSEQKANIGYGLTEMDSDDRVEVNHVKFTIENIPFTNVKYKSQGEEAIEIDFDEDDSETSGEDRDIDGDTPTFEGGEIKLPDEIEGKKQKVNYMYNTLEMTQQDIADVFDDTKANISYYLN